ncbi:pilus assembly protein [Thiocapsa bogorovii]|uniref:pilus assembly protein n=1 Tax=Thiocapsa bogorovii TaxID=521689 RepID=UPI001E57B193|nr:PilC/PilY family type IV pilus protein [Thiocapsa bogorovii]UHD17896.1 hypothetical protein LT988_07580 [Thiocapsa bogorovii]
MGREQGRFVNARSMEEPEMRGQQGTRSITPLMSRLGSFMLGIGLAFGGAPALHAEVTIANTPLFVMPPVIPALVLAVDDSGSMDSEVLMPANDGALWWNTNDNSFTGWNVDGQRETGVINFNRVGSADGTWKKFVYLFPNGSGLTSGRRAYTDSSNDHYAVPPIGAFAFTRSPEYNAAYFDPSRTYTPWPDQGGYSFENSNPAAAKTDPTRGTETYNLTALRERTDDNHVFRMFPGMVIPAGTRFYDWSNPKEWKTLSTDRAIDSVRGVPISFYPATFFLSPGTSLPEGFGYKPSATSEDGRAPDGSTMTRYEIRPENFESTAAYEAAIQNFANWFTYYRKRHASARGAIGFAFKDIEGFRIGAYRINSLPSPATDLTIRDLSNTTQRSDFFEQIYEDLNSGGTPNREAVNHMRAQFKRTDGNAPIQEACQMNFGVLLTDGYANNWTSAGVGNRDGSFGSPFADSVSNTMADIAMELYATNPRTNLSAGLVPVPVACNNANPDPWLDCNRNLHVNLFALTLGTTGTVFNVDADTTADPFAHPPTWPTSFSDRNPVHVDDLWHATINSRGKLVNVAVPSELGDRFVDVLDDIAARLETSATSASASSAVLQSDTQLFVAGFRSTDWSGEIEAYELDENGDLSDQAVWSAESRLLATTTRNLYTSLSPGGNSVALIWANLSAEQQAALNHAPNGTLDNLGSARVAWLRGTEQSGLRSRSGSGTLRLLGDIVYSNPQFVGKTDYGYSLLGGSEGNAYLSYRSSEAYRDRPDMLYVGANDGMMHAFDAVTGTERFAYMPSEHLLPAEDGDHAPITLLMDRNYAHRYYVDGAAAIGDAYVGGAWKTILVGSLGAGGRSVFALDVTNPGGFSGSDVLWEFTDEDLGYNVGQPEIVSMPNGDWAAVFGNGYNSAHQRAILFVVRLSDGALLAKIDTGVGDADSPNGLAATQSTDWPNNDLRANLSYAGDLQGNLWRFDLAELDASVLFNARDPSDAPQPITAGPNIAAHPDGRNALIVAFGTGSYFRTEDGQLGSPQVQTLYGLIDADAAASISGRDQLLQQTITWQGSIDLEAGTVAAREVSGNLPEGDELGWYMDLVPPTGTGIGERVVSAPTFPSGAKQDRVRFTTLIPDPDPCGTSRGGFLMDLVLASGGQTDSEVFDLNGDGKFDGEDEELADGRIVSGIGGSQGEELTVVRSADGGIDYLYGGRDKIIASKNEAGAIGRQSWRQLR